MKKTKETKTTTVWKDKCPDCKLIIKGSTENQVRYLMKIHRDAKHE